MKASTGLLAAWVVLIAALVAAIVFFTLSGQSTPDAHEPDAPVKAAPQKPKPPDPKGPTRHPSRELSRTQPAPRALEITGVVRAPVGEPVPGAQIAVFTPTKAGLPDSAPDMDELRKLSSILYISPEEWEAPRPLGTWSVGGDDESRATGSERASATTGDDGKFTIVLPPHAGSGPFRLSAVKEGVGSATAAEVRAGQTLDLTLGPASAVTGIVVTEVDSVPVAGARVTFDSGSRRFSTVTDADGNFRVEGVTPGFYQLSVAAKGKTPLFENRFRVAAIDTTPYTLRMPRGTILRVKAVLESTDLAPGTARQRADSGQPVPDAEIALYCEETYTYVLGRTNHEGIVDFHGMPAGRWALNGIAKGVVAMGEEQIVIDKNQMTQDESVTFEPAVNTPIEVVDDDGRPLAGVKFYSANSDEKYDALRSVEIGATDGDGKMTFAFEFDGPRCAIFGFKDGYALVHACPDSYDSGDPIRLVAKKPVAVRGRIHTPDGRAIPDAVITITISPTDDTSFIDLELEVRADKDGRYQFPYLPRTDGIMISATAPDGVSEEDIDLELVAGQDDYTADIEIDLDEQPPAPRTSPSPAPRVPGAPGNPMKDR